MAPRNERFIRMAYIGPMDGPLEFLIEPGAGVWTVRLGLAQHGPGFGRVDDAVQWASRAARLLWLDRQLTSVVKVAGDNQTHRIAAVFGDATSLGQNLNSDAQ